uniref:NGN domain-containing protein n=2 Tax=Moniliophthora roreri TaxID=221103 RepID=A0A0W0FBR6_MONRR
MELLLSSQQAEVVVQSNVRQFLDLEAAINRGGYDSEDDEGTDGFINNNNDDVERPINYQALNRALDADDHDSLFSDQDSLFSEPQDESAGDDSVVVGGSGLVLEQGNTTVGGVAPELDEDNPTIKRYRLQEVWLVKCKPYREQDLVHFIEGYEKKHLEDSIFSLTRPRSCSSGYVYIQTQDSPRAASILRGCMYTRRTRTGGINSMHMTVLSNPLDILHVLSMSSSIAKAITGGVEKCQPDPKKPVLKAGVWVRLGLIKKPKKEPNSEEEASGPPRKKTRLEHPLTQQSLTEENVPMGNMSDEELG